MTKVATGLARTVEQWRSIFPSQTDGSPEEVAARIIKDLWGYGHQYKGLRRYEAQDVESLANALRAYIRL